MLRITGMDLKMEQYRKGEAFVAEIERLAGADGPAPAVGRPRDAAAARGDRATRRVGRADGPQPAPGRDGVTEDPAGAGAAGPVARPGRARVPAASPRRSR